METITNFSFFLEHFKKYGAPNLKTSTTAIPMKKARYGIDTAHLGQNISVSSECTIESRGISVSTSATKYTNESNQGVFEVVCCSHCNTFEKQLQDIGKKLDDLQLIVEAQNTAIMDAIAVQKVATEQLIRQESKNAPITKYFPISDVPEMHQLEEKITPTNRDVYESAMSAILCNNLRNIRLLLNKDVIASINVDGSHGKISLKSFPNFYASLTGAIAKLPFKGLSPEDALRKAIAFEKAKCFKKAYRQKKKNSAS
ncbi:uncharacterized protein LOC109579422 isoform X1 [Bactrocera dorsalis]|uniref:Uncharacterized protein LOC109579422 isoform X1 n=2 Tax=Bactrocera TaxID=47832 RepID=A0ABM3K5J5_BACDO|nr:uncharacterized protein LOC109579422 isoform X1 [Bactrocera dorsalis]